MFAEKQRLVADLEAYGSGGGPPAPATPLAAAPPTAAPAATEVPAAAPESADPVA
jgi:hypothetical protein